LTSLFASSSTVAPRARRFNAGAPFVSSPVLAPRGGRFEAPNRESEPQPPVRAFFV